MFEALAGQMFDKALRKMIAAFEARADELYNPDAQPPIIADSNPASDAAIGEGR